MGASSQLGQALQCSKFGFQSLAAMDLGSNDGLRRDAGSLRTEQLNGVSGLADQEMLFAVPAQKQPCGARQVGKMHAVS
jgi:hypothetical protein